MTAGLFVAFPVHGVLWPQSMQAAMSLAGGGVFRMRSSPWLDSVRAELVGQFLESACDEILFMDADNWFDVGVVETMRGAKADVITATYRKRAPPYEFVARVSAGMHPKNAPHRMIGGKRVIEIERDGMGCCLIQRHVLETLCERHPELEYVNEGGAARVNLFEYGIYTDSSGVRRHGEEDRSFFQRTRAAGFKVECLADAVVFHGGIPGNFGAEILDG